MSTITLLLLILFQGGLIAILVAIKEQYLFDGIILSTAAVKANSQFVGAAIVSVLLFLCLHCNASLCKKIKFFLCTES